MADMMMDMRTQGVGMTIFSLSLPLIQPFLIFYKHVYIYEVAFKTEFG